MLSILTVKLGLDEADELLDPLLLRVMLALREADADTEELRESDAVSEAELDEVADSKADNEEDGEPLGELLVVLVSVADAVVLAVTDKLAEELEDALDDAVEEADGDELALVLQLGDGLGRAGETNDFERANSIERLCIVFTLAEDQPMVPYTPHAPQ